MRNRSKSKHVEQRKFIRLKSVFPVEFNLTRWKDDVLAMDWQQGYTCDVGVQGICMEVTTLTESTIKYLQNEHATLELRMRVPINKPPIKAMAQIQWAERIEAGGGDKFRIGLNFLSIVDEDLNRLLRHAQWFRVSAETVMYAAIAFFVLLLAFEFYNYQIKNEGHPSEKSISVQSTVNDHPAQLKSGKIE